MSLTFTTRTKLGPFSKKKLEALTTCLDYLGFTIVGFIVGDFAEYNDIYDQHKALYCSKNIVEKILLASVSEASFFLDDLKLIYLSMRYHDTPIYLSLFIKTTTNQLSLSFSYLDWKKDFQYASEDRMYDNGRYSHLFLDVLEPFVLQEFKIKCDYEYLDEQLPGNCLAVATNTGSIKFNRHVIDNIIFSKYSIDLTTATSNKLPKIGDIEAYFIKKTHSRMPIEIYLKDGGRVISKLIIDRNRDHIFLFPLEPYVMKTFDDEHGIDLQFYLRLLLNICNHYPIWELRTTLGSS